MLLDTAFQREGSLSPIDLDSGSLGNENGQSSDTQPKRKRDPKETPSPSDEPRIRAYTSTGGMGKRSRTEST